MNVVPVISTRITCGFALSIAIAVPFIACSTAVSQYQNEFYSIFHLKIDLTKHFSAGIREGLRDHKCTTCGIIFNS